MKPRARREGLVVKELPDEVLVYDTERHEAHCLNPSAALVFKACDGRTDVARIARRLQSELDAAADEKWVWLALDRLEKARLLEESPMASAEACSRRELLKRAGRAAGIAVLLPTVVTLATPKPAEAINTCVTDCSSSADGTPCHTGAPADCGVRCECQSNVCVDFGTGFGC